MRWEEAALDVVYSARLVSAKTENSGQIIGRVLP